MYRFAYLMLSFALLGPVIFTPETRAESDCDPVSGDAQGQATGPATFVTTVNLVVGGQPLTATCTATLLERQQAGNGAIQATTSHVFEVSGSSDGDGECEGGENCFTTLDRAILSPTDTPGLFRLNSHLEIISGNGAYADTCGRLVSHGFVNFGAPIPTVEWRTKGRICDCAP